jgi:UDP-glucose 4-epimerase
VAETLIRDGHKVIILDDLSGGFRENVPAGAEFVHGSILDASLIATLFKRHRIDFVYHLAAYAAEGLSHFIRHFNYQNNLIGSVNLINAAVNREVKCFVFTSSIAVYGRNQLPMTEDVVPLPIDPYGVAKLAVEQDLKAARDLFGLRYIVFRPHNVYGERQNIGDKYRNVLGIFMNNILQRKPMPIFGNGSQTRAFSYISDVAPLIARSIHQERAYDQVFNVGSDDVTSVKRLAELVADAMGVEPNIVYLPPRDEVDHAYPSHDKLRHVFGSQATTCLADGVARMATWVRQVGARSSREFEQIEIRKNLPLSWSK